MNFGINVWYMKQRTKIIVGILIAVAVGGSIWYARNDDPTSGIVTEPVRRGDVAQTVSVTGRLVPALYADLSPRTAGLVKTLSVEEGDAVKQGQLLVSLDMSMLESELSAARIAADIAYQSEKLARRGWNNLKPEERETKKMLSEQARERVRTVSTQMESGRIVSPIDGIVSKLDVRIGETVSPGVIVARVVADSELIVEAQVPESDIAKVRIGMTAKTTFDALTQKDIFSSTVTGIDPAATISQGVVSYLVTFRTEGIDERIRDGMTANIDIETAKAEGVLVIPFRALSKEGGKTYAEAHRGEERYEKIEITTGIEGDDGSIEVLSGLEEGDAVVVSRK